MPISGKLYYWGDKAKHVPEDSGVYAFYNKDKGLIYIGKSVNLRVTFTQYLETEFSNDPCKRETKYYQRELASNQQGRAKELLEEYRRVHDRLPDCNHPTESEKEVTRELGFHFYTDINEPLHEVALDIQGLKEKIGKVPVASLDFHQRRGDFAQWIKVAMNDTSLAATIQRIDKIGEELRTELVISLDDSKEMRCPACGVPALPVKTWKMAGRPSRAGVRLQLTIGFFRCHSCNKSFRRVLAKEKIHAARKDTLIPSTTR